MSTQEPAAKSQARRAAEALNEAVLERDQAIAVYARAKARVDAWKGPLKGELFEARARRWRAATLRLDRAAQMLRRARIASYLANRRLRRKGPAQ